jgi:hypothetical protein
MKETKKRVEQTMLAIKVVIVNILTVRLCRFSYAVARSLAASSFGTRIFSIDVINSS